MITTTFEIHPAIGVARVGSSRLALEEGYFVGPEPDGSPQACYRDPGGDLKRQAARFRLFECRRDEQHRLLSATEVTCDRTPITWTVHLANRKGTARRIGGRGFRNQVRGFDNADGALIIDPGPRCVNRPGERQVFDTGRFRTTPVTLGEIVMEPSGRLIVLGGHGQAGSDPVQGRLGPPLGTAVDNPHWYDDTSDGPVTAAVTLADGQVHVATAWVIVGPPDFAPGVMNIVTLYDYLYDRAVGRGLITPPTAQPGLLSFTRHVRPILQRAMGYRWVNRFAAFGSRATGRGHAPGGRGDFTRLWHQLADPSDQARELRSSIAGLLRNPASQTPRPRLQALTLAPRLCNVEYHRTDAGNVLPLTQTQYNVMQAWAEGAFLNDLDDPVAPAEPLPDALDRMALDACVGGPFFPGIEAANAVFQQDSSFLAGEPFRLSHAAVRPGDVTRANAVPWQADFHLCRWEQRTWIGRPKQLGWWPAQRPDDVFPAVDAAAMVPWARGLGRDYQEMVDKWDRLGVVVDRGPPRSPFFVETERDRETLGP